MPNSATTQSRFNDLIPNACAVGPVSPPVNRSVFYASCRSHEIASPVTPIDDLEFVQDAPWWIGRISSIVCASWRARTFAVEAGPSLGESRPCYRDLHSSMSKSGSPRCARRLSLRDSAIARLCSGVKLRCREGFVFSAHHSSTDHVLGCERSSFDVGCESSGCIGKRTVRPSGG